jgi:FHA domain
MKAPVLPPVTPQAEVDLDSTAELPVLDPAEMESQEEPNEAAEAAHTTSDTWILPPGARVLPPRSADTATPPLVVGSEPPERWRGPQAAAAKLRDVEQLAATQAEQLRELETSRAQAHAAHRAAEERVASLRAELTRRETDAEQHTAKLEAVTLARGLAEQQQALTAQAQAHSARLIEDLHLERTRSASSLESLQTLETRRRIAESVIFDLQREIDVWQSTEAELRGRLGARDDRVRELETELNRRATQIGDLEQQINSLETALAAERQRVVELEGELRTARESMQRLQAEAGSRGARIEALAKANEHWRTTAAVGREAPHGEAPHGETTHDGVLNSEPMGDGVARLLIHSDGEREVVHVLGRKTSIGRTPDNDLQIEGQHISRHHAVILAGPATTLIEDLNSTNGVMVNGRRIVRQVLQDGDQVTIGRTMYRFAVRRAGEPR